jgi:RimJ/RimL family protein N-acetyltransferase
MQARVPIAPIELERVRLRQIEESDADALFAIHSDREVARYQSKPAMTDRAQAEELVTRIRGGYADGSSMQLGIERKEDGALVGYCLLFHFHEESRRAEIGYSLDRRYWQRGYMHEALVALIGLAFGELGLNRLEADIDPRNASSERSLQRLGFKKEGHLRERWIVSGEVSDTVFYGLLRSEWTGFPPTRE